VYIGCGSLCLEALLCGVAWREGGW